MTPIRLVYVAAALATLLVAQQIPTIRVPVRVVTVPTLVFSNESQLISGLQKADFRVFDNGRLQTTLLDTTIAPVSVVIAIQVNQDVRSYAPFISKAGSVVETLLVGEIGEAAVIAYNGDVSVAKPFGLGDVQSTLGKISPAGRQARMIDAGVRAVALLRDRPAARARILLFIGQPMDSGSESSLDSSGSRLNEKTSASMRLHFRCSAGRSFQIRFHSKASPRGREAASGLVWTCAV